MLKMMDDARVIKSIHLADEGIFIGGSGVESIIPYHEDGEMSPVVWFAIYMRGEIKRRVNGKFVESVVYV